MAQPKTHSLQYLISELTATENEELRKIFSNPVVIKYFKKVALSAVMEKSMMDPDQEATDVGRMKAALTRAYQSGVISLADTILDLIPIKE